MDKPLSRRGFLGFALAAAGTATAGGVVAVSAKELRAIEAVPLAFNWGQTGYVFVKSVTPRDVVRSIDTSSVLMPGIHQYLELHDMDLDVRFAGDHKGLMGLAMMLIDTMGESFQPGSLVARGGRFRKQ